jgi:hypothetical protein
VVFHHHDFFVLTRVSFFRDVKARAFGHGRKKWKGEERAKEATKVTKEEKEQ